MTTERMIELLEIERTCMRRGKCDRCELAHSPDCFLTQCSEELDEMSRCVIERLKKDLKVEPKVLGKGEAIRRHKRYMTMHKELGTIFLEMRPGYSPDPLSDENALDETWHVNLRSKEYYLPMHDYGIQWRIWDQKPTNEQASATPWDTPAKEGEGL